MKERHEISELSQPSRSCWCWRSGGHVDKPSIGHGQRGSVMLLASVDFGELTIDDMISVVPDCVQLFSPRVRDFRLSDEGDAYLLVRRNLQVRLEPYKQRLFIQARKLNLHGADLSNDATLEVTWGDELGSDQFELFETSPVSGVWHYERSDELVE